MRKILSVILTIVMIVVPMAEMSAFALPSVVSMAEEVMDTDEVAFADDVADLEAEITYTVSFNANGGESAPLLQIKREYKNLVIKEGVPTRSGYTFAGWATSAAAEEATYVPGGIYSEDKDITLYAVWTDEYNGYESVAADYMVVSTPHKSYNDYEPTCLFGYESDYVTLEKRTEDSPEMPVIVNIPAEKLGIEEGAADDYLLNVFSVLAVLENGDIHSVVASQNKAVKKTVTELELCEVTTNRAVDYYDGTDAKLLSGKIMAGAEEIYVFNAPQSYTGAVYPATATAQERYMLNNQMNLRALSFDVWYNEGTPLYSAFSYDIVYDEYEANGVYANQACELVEIFKQIYYGGLYEADLYDIDGDGIYDFIDYKPYAVFQVDADEDEYFEDSDFSGWDSDLGIPYIYTNETTVLGEEFDDGDVVIGYFSESLEIVKVAEVIKPVVDYVKAFKKSTGTVTLGGGQVVDAVNSWSKVMNFVPWDVIFDADAYNEEIIYYSPLFSVEILGNNREMEFYIHDGVVLLAQEHTEYFKFTENLIIPTDIKDVKEAPFNPNTDNEVVYIYAYVDGSLKYVPVELNDDLEPWVTDGWGINRSYLNKPCTYTVDENGIYTIIPLCTDVWDWNGDIVSAGLTRDIEFLDDAKKKHQVYTEIGESEIQKIAGNRYDIGFERVAELKSDTIIVIREYSLDEDEYSYRQYDAATFDATLYKQVTLSNICAVIRNNPDSTTREELVLLYAEAPIYTGTPEEETKPEKLETTLEDIKNNLIIPTDMKDVKEAPFNPTADGEACYVYAWVDGTVKYVQVELNDDNAPWVTDGTTIAEEYLNKLCTYTVKDNIYTIYPLGCQVYDYDYDMVISDGLSTDIAVLNDTEKENLFFTQIPDTSIFKIATSRYDIGFERHVDMTSDTKIVIREYNEYNDEFTYRQYDAYTFDASLYEGLYNVSIVLSNNTQSIASENLVVLYAETYVYDETAGGSKKPESFEITLEDIKENLIIPTDVKDVKAAPFDPNAEEEIYYVYTWIDGSMKYVPVEYNDDLYPWITNGWEIEAAYLDKPCVYTVDENGVYTIYPLSADVLYQDEDVISKALSTDISVLDDEKNENLFYAELGDGLSIFKIAGTRFDVGFERSVDFTSNTRIIIRVYDWEMDRYEYVEFDSSVFTKSLESELYNVKIVVSNNPASTAKENLVFLYAEANELEFAQKVDKNGYRIVSRYEIGEDEDGNWRLFYELYNPYTGTKEKDVPSENSESKASNLEAIDAGVIIELVDGQVSDREKYMVGTVDPANLVWIAEIDEAEGWFSVVPYDETLVNINEIDDYVEEKLFDYTEVHDIYGEYVPGNYIDFDKNTVVSIVKNTRYDNNFWKDATMSLSDIATIAAAKKDVLCWNDKALDRNGNYVTRYSDYVKAYISVDADVGDDENPVAEFVIVVVNGGENAALEGSNGGSSNVETVSPTKVLLNLSELSLEEGAQKTLIATVKPDGATNKNVTWKSSDENVATVEDGVVTAVSKGNATITVTTADGGFTAECEVTVTEKTVSVSGVTLNKSTLSLEKGDTATLTATVAPENATNKNVIWKSSDEAVATVSNGVVTAVGEGMATIIAITEDASKSATCSVQVIKPREEIDENAPVISVAKVVGRKGGSVDVEINIENNPGITAFLINVEYDDEILTLTKITNGTTLAGPQHNADQLTKNPFVVNFADDLATENNTSNGTIITLTFDVAKDAEPSIAYVNVTYKPNDIYDADTQNVAFEIINGGVEIKDYIVGDLNDDGEVNQKDRTTLARHLAGWTGYEKETFNYAAADVNGDGEVNQKDRTTLARHLAGWEGYEVLS